MKMNSISSIHDTQVDRSVVETHQQSEIERSRLRLPYGSHPTDINIELYLAGFFDGLMGLNAELPHFYDYWDGYQIGYREYCCGLLGVKIPATEITTERRISSIAA